jgi:hypothetical protein
MRINTIGIIKDERRLILYLNCKIKKMRTMHQEKNDVASWGFVMGIWPAVT